MKRFLHFISIIVFLFTSFHNVGYAMLANPAPASPPVITVGMASGAILACAGSASQSPRILQFVLLGSNLTGNIIATAPPEGEFEISLTANGGYSSTVTLIQSGGNISARIVYVRSSASAPAGHLSGNITIASAGAVSQNVAVTGTINALPVVNPVTNQTFTAGNATTVYSFAGTGNSYTWVNDTPGIGLAASGTGNIPSFTAVNTGAIPLTATITVTPKMAALAYITNSASNNISVINTSTNQVSDTIHVGQLPFGAAVSPDQSTLYVTNQVSQTVSVIKTNTNTVVATIPVGYYPSSLVVSPDGGTVYALNGLGSSVSVINAATNLVTAVDDVGGEPYGIAVTPDGSRIYVANVLTSDISVITTSDNKTIATISVQKDPTGLAMSPDGSKVYVTNQGANRISVISTLTNSVTATITIAPPGGSIVLGPEPTGLAVSPDGTRLYVTNFGANNVLVINTTDNTITGSIPVGLEPYGLSVSPDGSRLYVANRTSNDVTVINTAANTVIKTIAVGTTPYAFGNFIADNAGCGGAPVTFTITVNPNTSPVITTGTVTGSITACQGTPSASPNIEQFPVSGVRLTDDITAAAPAGFEVSLSATGGYAGAVTLARSGAEINNAIIYMRSAASASPLNISGNVILTSAGAVNQDVPVSAIVNPLAAVSPVPDQIVANGALTTAINFTGTANAFSWVNDKPGIGLAASGAGDIPAFIAVNKGKNPVVATITVTPVVSPLAYISNAGDGTISVINTTTNKVITTITNGLGKFIQSLAASPDGSKVYVVNEGSDNVLVISTSTNSVIATIQVGYDPSGLLVSADGSRVYVANTGTDNISVIDAITNTVINSIPVGSNPINLALTPNGNFLYVTYGEDDLVISAVDTKVGRVVATIAGSYWYYGLAMAPDGSKVYATNSTNNAISVISTATNTITSGVPVSTPVSFGDNEIALSPDGTRLYVVNNYDNVIYVVDPVSGSLIASIKVGTDPAGASVSADGKWIYVANAGDGTVSVISTASNTVTSTIKVGASPVSLGNIFSPGPGCIGQPEKFTITVNPSPVPVTTSPVDVPNAFTPNGDGVNDTWNIKNIDAYPDCNVQVYTRYGQNIYSSIGYGNAWDGTYKGAVLPAGTYYFIINLKNGISTLSGSVAIIR